MRTRDHARVIVVAAVVSGCAHARSSSPPVDLSPPAGQATMLQTTQAEVDVRSGPPRAPRLEVSEAEGTPAGNLQTLFARAAGPLHRCLPGQSPGKLILRVSSKDGVLSIAPAPGFTLDDAGRSCALEALSRVYLPETGSNTGGVSIPPSGFTSLLTVAW